LFPPNARFFETDLGAAGRCIVKILVYYIPMRKHDFATGLFLRARNQPWAAIVGPRIGSGKIDSHAWGEQFVADNWTAERPQSGAIPGQDRAQKKWPRRSGP
jgi:hypothetical protein